MQEMDTDIAIIGAGAGGLTAAQYGARANVRVVVIEEMAPGGQALIIDRLENYPGYVEPKSGYEFAQDLYKQAQKFGATIITDSVIALKKENNHFILSLASGEMLTSYAVVLATGAKHRKLNIPGEAEYFGRGVSYCATCDGPFFKNKKMFVVGGGDAACDEAEFLSKFTDNIVLIHRRDRFRAQKALAERVLHNPNITVRFNTRMLEIKGDTKVRSVILEQTEPATGTIKRYEEETDAVFIFVGSTPQTHLVPEAKKDEGGYIITDQRMESSIPGLFVAGDVRATPFRQVVVAAAEGAIAAHCASQYIDILKGESYQ